MTWVDICDAYGTLTYDVTLDGAGAADLVTTYDVNSTGSLGACSITCQGPIDLGGHTVTLVGGAGSDDLQSNNVSGRIVFDGGADPDLMVHRGTYSGNIFYGYAGDDIIGDAGGTADALYGEAGDDCLETQGCPAVMDCGGDQDEYKWGWTSCCPSGEVCSGPANCETSVSGCGIFVP